MEVWPRKAVSLRIGIAFDIRNKRATDMATADKQDTKSQITGEAYELINCFYEGIDEVVYKIAKELARERCSAEVSADELIQIDIEDVRSAGQKVINMLRKAIAEGDLPQGMEAEVNAMDSCFSTKATEC